VEELLVAIDSGWAAGFVLSMTRVAGFVIASPLLNRVVPVPGRMAVTLALGLFLANPLEVEPTITFLLSAAAVNAAIGITLGYLSGLILNLFPVAGSVIDMTSGLASAAMIDPTRGEQGAVFSRIFNLLALALFYAAGGLALLVRGLDLSVRVIPLDGAIAPSSDLVSVAAATTGRLFLAGVELAIPVLAALFVTELVLGIASRFAPQANIFLVGLPAKIFVALTMSSLSLLLFPETMEGTMRHISRTITQVLRGLGG
jgi:flagellar biosynthesis protein FliR